MCIIIIVSNRTVGLLLRKEATVEINEIVAIVRLIFDIIKYIVDTIRSYRKRKNTTP